jgi:hypothetical protein
MRLPRGMQPDRRGNKHGHRHPGNQRGPGSDERGRHNRHTREHWGIENKNRYTRDTVFREDCNQGWKRDGPRALASFRNLATGLFRLKNATSIKEATEMVHIDRMPALHYIATMRSDHCAALPANNRA